MTTTSRRIPTVPTDVFYDVLFGLVQDPRGGGLNTELQLQHQLAYNMRRDAPR